MRKQSFVDCPAVCGSPGFTPRPSLGVGRHRATETCSGVARALAPAFAEVRDGLVCRLHRPSSTSGSLARVSTPMRCMRVDRCRRRWGERAGPGDRASLDAGDVKELVAAVLRLYPGVPAPAHSAAASATALRSDFGSSNDAEYQASRMPRELSEAAWSMRRRPGVERGRSGPLDSAHQRARRRRSVGGRAPVPGRQRPAGPRRDRCSGSGIAAQGLSDGELAARSPVLLEEGRGRLSSSDLPALTDPIAPYLAKSDGGYDIGGCYLTISLGEPYRDACYKLIAAIIPAT